MVSSKAVVPILFVLGAAGCGSKEDAVVEETKPSEVKQSIDPATRQRLETDLKNFKPDKRK